MGARTSGDGLVGASKRIRGNLRAGSVGDGRRHAQTARMNTTKINENLSLSCLGICLIASLALFVYQLAAYTTLLG